MVSPKILGYLELVNMTLFKNRVFANIIKLGIRVGCKSIVTDVLIVEISTQTQR